MASTEIFISWYMVNAHLFEYSGHFKAINFPLYIFKVGEFVFPVQKHEL